MIDSFKGDYCFLSNFYEAKVTYEGITYLNNEAAFQSIKTTDMAKRRDFADLDPAEAKKAGRNVSLRGDWEDIKINVMYKICKAKFTQNSDIAEKLLATGDEELVEGNDHGDKIWGKVNGEGANNLGKILMRVREELKMSKFDAKKVKDEIVQWIKDYFEENATPETKAVIGISGGKDSSVAAALCVEALGKDRVIGVLMPQGEQFDIDCSKQLVNHLGIKSYEINVGSTVSALLGELGSKLDVAEQARVNTPPRIRMTTLYAVAACVGGRVVNTCNMSEDWVGYSTKFGDSAGDFSPLSELVVREVIAVGDELGIPYELTHKTPIDGLCGKTDEDNLGFTYAELDSYIRQETDLTDKPELKTRIDGMHARNLHKLLPMPKFEYKG